MKTHLTIVAVAALAVVLVVDAPKASGAWSVTLAQSPVQITSGIYAGKIEYFFDFYMTSGDSMYYQTLVGLDNSKIANAQTHEPAAWGGDFVRTQQWGEGPDSWFSAKPGWSIATGRIFDLWTKDSNSSFADANIDNMWRSSFDDGSGGWEDASLGYPDPALNNPHSYSEYGEYHGGGANIWKAELTGLGQPRQWQMDMFGTIPTQDMILLMGTNYGWAPGSGGLVATIRVVYDEEIDPNVTWIGVGGTEGDVQVTGDFTVIPEPATMSLLALGGLAVIRRRRKA